MKPCDTKCIRTWGHLQGLSTCVLAIPFLEQETPCTSWFKIMPFAHFPLKPLQRGRGCFCPLLVFRVLLQSRLQLWINWVVCKVLMRVSAHRTAMRPHQMELFYPGQLQGAMWPVVRESPFPLGSYGHGTQAA